MRPARAFRAREDEASKLVKRLKVCEARPTNLAGLSADAAREVQSRSTSRLLSHTPQKTVYFKHKQTSCV
jgi:hypothetical protein